MDYASICLEYKLMGHTGIAFEDTFPVRNDWEELVSEFERCVLPKPKWTHAAHLVVGTWYCTQFDLNTAIDKLRSNIRAHNDRVGTINSDTSGYHETITIFWARTIAAFIKSRPETISFPELADMVVEAFGHKSGLFREYYSFDIVASAEARKSWIEPDIRTFGMSNPS
jgi:hypothetical protein